MGGCDLVIVVSLLFLDLADVSPTSVALQNKLKEAQCKVTCLKRSSSELSSAEACETCMNSVLFEENNHSVGISENFKPQLYCRQETMLCFNWTNEINDTNQYSVLELTDRVNNTFIMMTHDNNITFVRLQENSDYKLRLWYVGVDGRITGPHESNWTQTLKAKFIPKPVKNVWLEKLDFVQKEYVAQVRWEPSEDRTCFYEAVWTYGSVMMYDTIEIKEPEGQFSLTIPDLLFDTDYNVSIIAKGDDKIRESPKISHSFHIPSCLEVYNSLIKCPPSAPIDLKAEEIWLDAEGDLDELMLKVVISWAEPLLKPDYYFVKLVNSANDTIETNITGEKTNVSYHFPQILFNWYYVTVSAGSVGGESKSSIFREITIKIPSSIELEDLSGIFIVVAIVVAMTLSVIIILYLHHRHRKQKRKEERCRYFQQLEQNAPKDTECISVSKTGIFCKLGEPDKFEINSDRIQVKAVLGEGAFGIVHWGWLTDLSGDRQQVAVKMLKENASAKDIYQFKQEIDMMKSVGSHPHLVSIIGCYTEYVDRMMLVVEYCTLGDLQNYLRRSWNKLTPAGSNRKKYQWKNEDELARPSIVVNKLYEWQFAGDNDEEDDYEPSLTSSDLLSFARQIAIGMEYLSNNRIVHRDLAARNVLITENRTMKIADFGLSRDVYQDNMYRQSGDGKLPIKWMALESLTHQMYTTKSDVWSFGILLWEIVTLGGTPYPSIPTRSLLKLLWAGYRMECPNNCSEELYILMLSCWKAHPKNRPSFTEIKISLDQLLELETPSQYLSLEKFISDDKNSNSMVHCHSVLRSTNSGSKGSSQSSDHYIKPFFPSNFTQKSSLNIEEQF